MTNGLALTTVLAPLAAVPLLLGPALPAHPAPAAPAAASCKVVQGYSATTWAIEGSGFPGDTAAVTGDNGYDNPAAKVTAGSVRLSGLPAGHYTVGGVACTGGTAPAQDGTGTGTGADAKARYDSGFRKGFQSIRADCSAKQPNTLGQVDPVWQKGYDAGAALAATTFCGGHG
ncbi:hypothetical protein ACIPW5_14430 [Streptomyces sp. NPDC090077]|uniref:hypothetical protein n=1 Tax=Streptomyces sp. NPDC090077 TaxID=3365938 RepID=UPI00381B9C7F